MVLETLAGSSVVDNTPGNGGSGSLSHFGPSYQPQVVDMEAMVVLHNL